MRASLISSLSLADVIWYYESSNGLFATTMSMKHFQFISHFIEFDVMDTSEERCKHDKFACMRYIFDEVNCKFAKDWNPRPFLAIDEMLYRHWGHISFKQYNPSKLAKYGLWYHSLCDASVPYTYYSLLCTGKTGTIDDEANKYYVTGTDNYTKYLVMASVNSTK